MQANSSPLLGLRDIHEPLPVSWWPLAPGYWALIILFVVSLAVLIVWMRSRHPRRQFQRQAIESLNAVKKHFYEKQNLQQYLCELSTLLRRLLINSHADAVASRLRGDVRCDYLNSIIRQSGVKNPVYFTQDDVRLMDLALYQKSFKQQPIDTAKLHQSTLQLIAGLSSPKFSSTRSPYP